MSNNIPDYSCELATVRDKLYAVAELSGNIDTDEDYRDGSIMGGIKSIIEDVNDELMTISNGLYPPPKAGKGGAE